MWTRTSLSQAEYRLTKERENAAYSHHHPIEGALTQQITLPIPISYHEMAEQIQDFGEINSYRHKIENERLQKYFSFFNLLHIHTQ